MLAGPAALASILIDGSVLEGGGQILRNSVSLSALLRKPVTIYKVRNNRSTPGLKNQHATGIRLAAEICGATTSGVETGSQSVQFHPSPGMMRLPGNFSADSITAGSITLLLQVALPCLLFSSALPALPSTLELRGGTNAALAPQIDYTQHVFLPFLRRHFGLNNLTIDVRRRGYARGGGIVSCSVMPINGPLPPVRLLSRGVVLSVRGLAQVAGLPASLSHEMAQGASEALIHYGINPGIINIQTVREKDQVGLGAGSGIVLWAETEGGCFLGGSAIGGKKQTPKYVGASAAEELIKALRSSGCVDEYLQDQIIIFMALAEGKSSVKSGPLELHTKTAIWVAEHLTDAKFEIEEEPSGQCIIHCQGIGYRVPSF